MAKSMPRQKPGVSVQEVRTPKVFLDAVKLRLGIDAFAVDLAADKYNTIAAKFYSERSNALVQPWNLGGFNWLNPPFAKLDRWVRKAYEESLKGAKTAMLVPSGVGSNWWRDWVHERVRVLFLNGRITFVGHAQPYPKDCALLLYDTDRAPGYESWSWMKPPAEWPKDEPIERPVYVPTYHNFDDGQRVDLAARNAEHDSEFYVLVNDAQAQDIASGYVPDSVKAQVRTMLDWQEEDRRRAERPMHKPKKRKRTRVA